MSEFETKSTKSEKVLQQEAVAELASRLNKNDAPRSVEDLRELTSGIEAEWREGGYGNVASFVGQEGDIVMMARKEQDQSNGQLIDDHPDRLRFLIDDEVVDVSVPPAMRPQRLGVRGEPIGIYDTSLVSEDNVPEDMRRLVEKFGERLSITAASPQQEVASLNDGYYDFRGVAKETERQRKEYAQAEAEAHDIENEARNVASSVKRRLFMTARKLAALQDKAYRDAIRAKGPRGFTEKEWHAYVNKSR